VRSTGRFNRCADVLVQVKPPTVEFSVDCIQLGADLPLSTCRCANCEKCEKWTACVVYAARIAYVGLGYARKVFGSARGGSG
jgi:hypothetical protein